MFRSSMRSLSARFVFPNLYINTIFLLVFKHVNSFYDITPLVTLRPVYCLLPQLLNSLQIIIKSHSWSKQLFLKRNHPFSTLVTLASWRESSGGFVALATDHLRFVLSNHGVYLSLHFLAGCLVAGATRVWKFSQRIVPW